MSRRREAALLGFVLAGPVDLVAGGELDLFRDLGDGLFDGGAEVAVADAVLDGDVALALFAGDGFGSVDDLGLGDLGEGDALAGGGEEADVADGLGGGAVAGVVAGGDVVAGFAIEDLGNGGSGDGAADGSLDGGLDVGDVDAVAGGGGAVYGVVEVGLADDAEEAEVGDALDAGHDPTIWLPLASRVRRSVP